MLGAGLLEAVVLVVLAVCSSWRPPLSAKSNRRVAVWSWLVVLKARPAPRA
jgi:hypothetical protein